MEASQRIQQKLYRLDASAGLAAVPVSAAEPAPSKPLVTEHQAILANAGTAWFQPLNGRLESDR